MSKKQCSEQRPTQWANLDALIPALAEFSLRVARGEATSEEIKFMSKVADIAEFQGDEFWRKKLSSLRYELMA